MEPLQFSFCEFVTQQTQTFNIYYRTQVELTPAPEFTFQSLNIYYRINNGSWIVAGIAESYRGPSSYVGLPSISVEVNDLVEYYFDSLNTTTQYGYGNGGPFFGSGPSSSSTVVVGNNTVYFNICSDAFSNNSYFCSFG